VFVSRAKIRSGPRPPAAGKAQASRVRCCHLIKIFKGHFWEAVRCSEEWEADGKRMRRSAWAVRVTDDGGKRWCNCLTSRERPGQWLGRWLSLAICLSFLLFFHHTQLPEMSLAINGLPCSRSQPVHPLYQYPRETYPRIVLNHWYSVWF